MDALTTSALPPLFYLDRASRGRLRVTGRDRQSFLQGMVTNDVAGLAPGHGCYAFLCDATAHVLADVHILNAGDYLLLDVEPGMATFVKDTLERYLIMEKCRITDVSADTRQLLIGGTAAADFLSTLDVADAALWPEGANASVALTPEASTTLVARTALLAMPTFDVYLLGAEDETAPLQAALESAGATAIRPDQLDALRIEAGIPLFGVDIDAKVLAPETGQAARAIHRRKGCYIGQEIVARIDARGHTNRSFAGFRITGEAAPTAGAAVLAEGRDVGRVTSSIVSPAFGPIALGYLRNDVADAGTPLTIDGVAACVVELPFGND